MDFTETPWALDVKVLGSQKDDADTSYEGLRRKFRVPFSIQTELRQDAAVYNRLGFPGCIASIDGTKIYWDKCPEKSRNYNIGKEKTPCLGFIN